MYMCVSYELIVERNLCIHHKKQLRNIFLLLYRHKWHMLKEMREYNFVTTELRDSMFVTNSNIVTSKIIS